MARLRFNNLQGTLGASLTASATSVTFAAALTYQQGTAVPTITGSDYIPLTLEPGTANEETVSLTAYTSGATTGTITRGVEGAGVSHSNGVAFIYALTAGDIGAAFGLATLDGTSNVPLSQLGNAPSGTASGIFSVYLMYNTGTTFFIKAWYTGTTYASSTSAATIAGNLGTLLNGSTNANPIVVYIDPSVSLSGQTWATYGTSFSLLGVGGAMQTYATYSQPNLGFMTLGVSGHTAGNTAIYYDSIVFETEQIVDYGLVSDIHHNNCAYSGVNTHAIDIENTGTGGIQYLSWTGTTTFASGSSKAVQDFFYVNGLGSTASLGHSFFEYIQQVGSTTLSTYYMFHIANGTKWHRLEVGGIDLNTNGTGYTPTLVQFDGGSSSNVTQCPAIWFGFVHWEQHQTNANLVGCGSFSAGSIETSIVIVALRTDTTGPAIFNNGGGVFSGSGFFIELMSIQPDGSATVGTWNEDATFPIRVGTCRNAHTPLNTGNILATPKSSGANVLSLGGSASFATGTTYTCGGTKLGALLNGTTTLKSSDGTTILSAVALTNEILELVCGMTLLVASGGSAVFWKAE